MAMTSWGGNPPDWKRMHPREDDQRPIMAQVVECSTGFLGYARPWPTFEPRVRMDIVTAVQLRSQANLPVPLAMLTESAPVELESRLYRDKLRDKARMARQEAMLFPTMHRRRTDRELLKIEIRENKLLRVLAWVAIACVAGILICLALLLRRFAA